MTEIDQLDLGRRLRALRVDPPDNGFEAKLAEGLFAVIPDPVSVADPSASALRAPARVIIGPWRRGPVRLIGATALLVAGAAAALDGGVVEWLETRVLSAPAEPTPAPSLPALHRKGERTVARAAVSHAVEAPKPELATPVPEILRPSPVPAAAAPSVPRLTPERHERLSTRTPRVPEARQDSGRVSVPRVEIEPRAFARGDSPEGRVDRTAPVGSAMALPRERGPDLERIRDVARARRERAASSERLRPIDRLRERRERAAVEPREMQPERLRRERTSR